MELDRETIYTSIREHLIMPDSSCEKESTPAAYLSPYDGDTREFIDFRYGSVVFYTGDHQELLDKKLGDLLSFIDKRKDFEVYLAGALPLKSQDSRVQVAKREDLSFLLFYLEEKLKKRERILADAGFQRVEEYNEKSGSFLPYLALVIDKATELERDPSEPLAKLISMILIYSDCGFRVISGSTEDLNSANGKYLQGGAFIEGLNEVMLSFAISHNNHHMKISTQPSEIASDPIYEKVVEYTMQEKNVTILKLQKKFRIGFSKACRIIEEMQRSGVFDILKYQDYQKKRN